MFDLIKARFYVSLAFALSAAIVTLSATPALCADESDYYRTITLRPETSGTVTIELVPNSIVMGRSEVTGKTQICDIKVRATDLEKTAVLAKTLEQNTVDVSAGRYCMIFPLEGLVSALKNAGSLTVPLNKMLTETRELVRTTGDVNFGKCRRMLQEWIQVELPGSREHLIYLGGGELLEYTEAQSCGFGQ